MPVKIKKMTPEFIEKLHDLFTYDGENLRWGGSKGNQAKLNSICGGIVQGYRRIGIDGEYWPAHRLIWAFVHGKEPEGFIDHINGNKLDNRIENLRECTNAENLRNRGPNKNNKFGIKGISRLPSKNFSSYIRFLGKRIHLGTFTCVGKAIKARKQAEHKYFGEFA